MAPSERTRKGTTEGPRKVAPRGAGIRWDATPIRSSAPPVRIVGSGARYRGGYRVNV